MLRGALPPPLADDPADEARRDWAAMAGVAALRLVNAVEGKLAAWHKIEADALAGYASLTRPTLATTRTEQNHASADSVDPDTGEITTP